MSAYFKKNIHILILIFILVIAAFSRSYKAVERLEFGHDADLYSWIVKDVVVDHHFRLIGQLTAAPGIFIGPLFYYLIIPFFLLSKMNPNGVVFLGIILGVLTTFSYYFVFTKLFRKEVGLIASFLYAVLIYSINFDKWIVPTITTPLWSVWYLYILIKMSQRDFSVLPILGLLIGLIWNIHIALAPTLIAIPVAILFSKKVPHFTQIIIFLLIAILTSTPFILFEARHGFSQTKSLVKNFTANFGTSNNVSQLHKIVFGQKNEYGKLNLDENSKFTLDIEPQVFKEGDIVNIKVSSKNTKYSTSIINLDCGDPQRYEIGYISAEFKWSTKGCKGEEHKLKAFARTPGDSIWKKTIDKFFVVFEKEKNNIHALFVPLFNLSNSYNYLLTVVFLITPVVAWSLKIVKFSFVGIIYSWIFGVFAFFTFSSIPISEYYIASINTLLILTISLLLERVYRQKKIGRYSVIFLLSMTFTVNLIYFVNQENYKNGYVEKKQTVEFIVNNSKLKGFPCIGINYVSGQGGGVGFRYLFYLNRLHTTHSSLDVPVYNIVIPEELSKEVDKKFGRIGIILPKGEYSKDHLSKTCSLGDTNLTDSMLGYVE